MSMAAFQAPRHHLPHPWYLSFIRMKSRVIGETKIMPLISKTIISVKMLWQPDVESAPLVVRLPGCADLCPLDHWVSLTSDVTIDMDTWTRHSSHIT